MSEGARVSQETIVKITDLVEQKLSVEKTYTWADWWKVCVQPTDIGKNGYSYLDMNLRHQIKAGINEELTRRKSDKRLFVRKNIGVFVLHEASGVAAQLFLDRMKKMGNAIDTAVDRCRDLAKGMDEDSHDRRMLDLAANAVDTNKSMLIGTVHRMRSIPQPVKDEAIRHLGGMIESDDVA